ncbi:hypothetical protein BXZ70DRAFT_450224 [Cristinia sonorae]|uniref:Uncharacterized protein n=1 Tax=Cristinia sonorae TaxID=1940300 RepID=A0A8K0UJ53_9AGAR|nr:hypothetical protein BXZ70DRAFT_450224 [Cristinia sonorae]
MRVMENIKCRRCIRRGRSEEQQNPELNNQRRGQPPRTTHARVCSTCLIIRAPRSRYSGTSSSVRRAILRPLRVGSLRRRARSTSAQLKVPHEPRVELTRSPSSCSCPCSRWNPCAVPCHLHAHTHHRVHLHAHPTGTHPIIDILGSNMLPPVIIGLSGAGPPPGAPPCPPSPPTCDPAVENAIMACWIPSPRTARHHRVHAHHHRVGHHRVHHRVEAWVSHSAVHRPALLHLVELHLLHRARPRVSFLAHEQRRHQGDLSAVEVVCWAR